MTSHGVRIETKNITDWNSFHSVFAETMGFPDYYGRNMNAWIDCMTYLDEDPCMTKVTVAPGELFHLEVADAADFQKRVPELFEALTSCSAFVDSRRVEAGEEPILALVLL